MKKKTTAAKITTKKPAGTAATASTLACPRFTISGRKPIPAKPGTPKAVDITTASRRTGWGIPGLAALWEAAYPPGFAPSIIVPGMRIMDLAGPGEPSTGTAVTVARNGVAYIVEPGPGVGESSVGEVWVADWDCVAICPDKDGSTAAKPADNAIPGTGQQPTAGPRPPFIYSPELAAWVLRCGGSDNEFKIHEANERGLPGVLIATIIVNPALDKENADRVATLISYAPDLWQSLQKVAPAALSVDCPNTDFCDALDTLWQSADRFPFEWPHIDTTEQSLIKSHSNEVTAQLVKAGAA